MVETPYETTARLDVAAAATATPTPPAAAYAALVAPDYAVRRVQPQQQ